MASIRTPDVLPITSELNTLPQSHPVLTETTLIKPVTKTLEDYQLKLEKPFFTLLEESKDQGIASAEISDEINLPLPPQELPSAEAKPKKKWNIKRFQKVFKRSKKSVIASENE